MAEPHNWHYQRDAGNERDNLAFSSKFNVFWQLVFLKKTFNREPYTQNLVKNKIRELMTSFFTIITIGELLLIFLLLLSYQLIKLKLFLTKFLNYNYHIGSWVPGSKFPFDVLGDSIAHYFFYRVLNYFRLTVRYP